MGSTVALVVERTPTWTGSTSDILRNVTSCVSGIWSMGTLPDEQGKGIGKVLLSQVMDGYRHAGTEAFFLGATPAGQPLYEKLGYREVSRAQVWVRGETGQA